MTKHQETAQALTALAYIVAGKIKDFGQINFPIEACEEAARISELDATFCKMLNKQFRNDAAAFAFAKAQ